MYDPCTILDFLKNRWNHIAEKIGQPSKSANGWRILSSGKWFKQKYEKKLKSSSGSYILIFAVTAAQVIGFGQVTNPRKFRKFSIRICKTLCNTFTPLLLNLTWKLSYKTHTNHICTTWLSSSKYTLLWKKCTFSVFSNLLPNQASDRGCLYCFEMAWISSIQRGMVGHCGLNEAAARGQNVEVTPPNLKKVNFFWTFF